MPDSGSPVARILVVQLRQIGDILLTTPAIRALRQAFPAARITCLTHPMGRLILQDNPDVSEHVVYDPEGGALAELRVALALRRQQFSLAFDFMNNPRSAFYTWASGARRRVAFRSARRLAYTVTVPKPVAPDYIVRDKFRLLTAVGIAATSERLILPWQAADSAPLRVWLATTPQVADARLRVVLSPTHRREPRRWPLAAYAALADQLQTDWGATVVWTWGPGEEAAIDQAMALCRLPSVKAPATSFRGLAALLANCDLFVGNSNGPSHVAVACDTPSLQLHGHTSARAWCPETPRHQALQSPEYTGDRGGAGPLPRIDLISGAAVWERLQTMRPVIEAAAAARQTRGFRATWQPPMDL